MSGESPGTFKGNILRIGDVLKSNDWMASANGRFRLEFTIKDGLSLYRFEKGDPVKRILQYRWCPGGSFCEEGQWLEMRPPGYLALMSLGEEVGREWLRQLPLRDDVFWQSIADANGWFILQDEGNLVIYPEKDPSCYNYIAECHSYVDQSVVARTVIPGVINLEVDGQLGVVSDKTATNTSSKMFGVSDGKMAVTVLPGQNYGVQTTTGVLVINSGFCELNHFQLGASSNDQLPWNDLGKHTIGPDQKFIAISDDPGVNPGQRLA
jgi:hypothetical protein